MNTERTVNFYMANLGSEVSRILAAKAAGDKDRTEKSRVRAQSILMTIINDPAMRKRLAEMNLLKEIIDDISTEKPAFNINPIHLKSYFFPFAKKVLSN